MNMIHFRSDFKTFLKNFCFMHSQKLQPFYFQTMYKNIIFKREREKERERERERERAKYTEKQGGGLKDFPTLDWILPQDNRRKKRGNKDLLSNFTRIRRKFHLENNLI